jgi:hypothetical protein
MIGDSVHLGAGSLSQSEPHDEFLELCAISTSGQLTEEERQKLQQHLAVCPSCREALREYESIVDQAVPSIAAGEKLDDIDPGPGWSQKQAEKRFLDRLAGQEEIKSEASWNRTATRVSGSPSQRFPLANDSAWSHMWLLYAAGILLFVALSLFSYRVGLHRGSDMARLAPPTALQPTTQDQTSLEEQLSDAGHERALAHLQIAQRDKTIADLRRQLSHESDEINQMRAAQEKLENSLRSDSANQAEVTQQRAELTEKLKVAEGTSRELQAKLDSLAQQSAQDALRANASGARVNDLTKLLQDREAELEQQDQLLAHDRDIRELMGARDLYIAEVYDVGGTGETKKPYGRIFYTRGKSLIFYAYDLDQQSELKRASSFQAWGRRGPDRQQAVKLGIFYEDNASRKRWIMKCNDPKTLAQIDAVFVTVEPGGGSHKPSSKTLLFAYLKVNPNHP